MPLCILCLCSVSESAPAAVYAAVHRAPQDVEQSAGAEYHSSFVGHVVSDVPQFRAVEASRQQRRRRYFTSRCTAVLPRRAVLATCSDQPSERPGARRHGQPTKAVYVAPCSRTGSTDSQRSTLGVLRHASSDHHQLRNCAAVATPPAQSSSASTVSKHRIIRRSRSEALSKRRIGISMVACGRGRVRLGASGEFLRTFLSDKRHDDALLCSKLQRT